MNERAPGRLYAAISVVGWIVAVSVIVQAVAAAWLNRLLTISEDVVIASVAAVAVAGAWSRRRWKLERRRDQEEFRRRWSREE